jgi:hypothetical protein
VIAKLNSTNSSASAAVALSLVVTASNL